jgi:hypothetical protein
MATKELTMTTQEVAARFDELAQQEKWFEIQDEFFADNVRSVDPPNSPYFGYAEGKAAVREKGKEFVGKIQEVHRVYTSKPLVSGNHFAVGREKDITVQGFGIQSDHLSFTRKDFLRRLRPLKFVVRTYLF